MGFTLFHALASMIEHGVHRSFYEIAEEHEVSGWSNTKSTIHPQSVREAR